MYDGLCGFVETLISIVSAFEDMNLFHQWLTQVPATPLSPTPFHQIYGNPKQGSQRTKFAAIFDNFD